MKRALAMALGAMLVAGSAVPAAAKSQVDFSGMYRTYMYGVWNPTFTTEKGDDGDNPYFDNDFFLADRLQLDFGFHATDEVSVYWRLRAPASQRWGTYDASSSIVSRYYYGEVKQDWGTISAGRLKDAYTDLGLASLGYAPDGPDVNATGIIPFDFDTPMSGIRYANRTDSGFQFAAAILRPATQRSKASFDAVQAIRNEKAGTVGSGRPGYGNTPSYSGGHDETTDFFVIEPAYFWDGGAASFGIQYLRDHVQGDNGKSITNGGAPGFSGLPAYKEYAINPAFIQSFGDFSIHFEGKAAWGKAADILAYFPEDPADSVAKEIKSTGYALYLDGDYNYGPGNIGLAAWWAAGPGKAGDDKVKGAVGMGDSFAPLIVAYGANGTPASWNSPGGGMYNAIEEANDRAATDAMANNPNSDSNHMAIDINGAHAFTDDLTFTYAIAYLKLNKADSGAKKLIGYEADLGLQLQLLDNLHLGTTIGYLKAGDAMKMRDEETGEFGKKPDDAYSWFTTLTFSF